MDDHGSLGLREAFYVSICVVFMAVAAPCAYAPTLPGPFLGVACLFLSVKS